MVLLEHVDRVLRARSSSAVVQLGARTIRGSALVASIARDLGRLRAGLGDLEGVVDSWRRSSAVVTLLHDASRGVAVAASDASVTNLTTRMERWIRSSFGYRWLTAEPEPEVVVIDLRDTFTVGPFLTLLDDLVELYLGVRPASSVHNAIEATIDYVLLRPIRAGSVVLLGGVATHVAFTIAFREVDVNQFFDWVALAVLGAHGLGYETTLEELSEMREVQLLIAALEPPEPPEEFESDPMDPESSEPADEETHSPR